MVDRKEFEDLAVIFFPHDINAWADSKLQMAIYDLEYSVAYSIYFTVVERLYENRGWMTKKDYKLISRRMGIDEDKIKQLVEDYDLFDIDDDFYISSKRVTNELRDRLTKSRSGAKGAKIANEIKAAKKGEGL